MRRAPAAAVDYQERGVCSPIGPDPGETGGVEQRVRQNNARPTRRLDIRSMEGGQSISNRRIRSGQLDRDIRGG